MNTQSKKLKKLWPFEQGGVFKIKVMDKTFKNKQADLPKLSDTKKILMNIGLSEKGAIEEAKKIIQLYKDAKNMGIYIPF